MPSFIVTTSNGFLWAYNRCACAEMPTMTSIHSEAIKFSTRREAQRWIARRNGILARASPGMLTHPAFQYCIEEVP